MPAKSWICEPQHRHTPNIKHRKLTRQRIFPHCCCDQANLKKIIIWIFWHSDVCVWPCASYQVLGEIIDELSVVQALVIVEVVLKHGCDLLWSHHRSTNSHCILTCLHDFIQQNQYIYKTNTVIMCVCLSVHFLLYLDNLWVWIHQV